MREGSWTFALAVIPAVVSALISWWYNHRFLGVTQFREHEKELQEIRMRMLEVLRDKELSHEQNDLYGEMILNAYESFCGSYIYGIIERKRFEQAYRRQLQGLFNDEYFKERLSRNLRSYPCLRQVHRKLGLSGKVG